MSTSVYKVQCKTFKIAQKLSGITTFVSRGTGHMKPPFCLRVLRPYRTPQMQNFRDLVAHTVKQERRT